MHNFWGEGLKQRRLEGYGQGRLLSKTNPIEQCLQHSGFCWLEIRMMEMVVSTGAIKRA